MRLSSLASTVLLGVLGTEAHPGLSSGQDEPTNKTPFSESQLLDVTGRHAFRPPGPRDARGPCPGLNALANHGFLPHSGFATIPQFVDATVSVFGMGVDLATILAAYGAAVDGVGVAWSIAGGRNTGIGGSHGNYESDSSPLRADLKQHGSNTKLVMSQFHDLYNLQPDPQTANYNIEVLSKFRSMRYQESIEKNPDFYYGPFSGAVVTQAAYFFIYRFMGNKSAEHPDGILNKDVLKSFMAIEGPEDNLRWKPGHERIPHGWYTRNKEDRYNITRFSTDFEYIGSAYPEVLQGGCNMGKVNSFQKIDVMSKEKNPLCNGLKFALARSGSLGPASFVLQQFITPVLNTAGCKTVPAQNSTIGKTCPGYSLYGGPTAKPAKGAIRD